MKKKICSKCKNEKSLSEFGERKAKYKQKEYIYPRSVCKVCDAIQSKKAREKNPNYLEKNRAKRKIYDKRYKEKNPETFKKSQKKYKSKRFKNDTIFRLKTKLKAKIFKQLKNNGFKKTNKTIDILSCSINEFKIYIENKFELWMNWENYGKYNGKLNFGWDLDHIIPLSTAKTKNELIKLFHYTNYQPLCSKTNRDIKKNNVNYNIIG